jgi:hypothetical protein
LGTKRKFTFPCSVTPPSEVAILVAGIHNTEHR